MPIILPSIFYEIPRNPVLAVGIPVVLGATNGIITRNAIQSGWYDSLSRPPAEPPRQAFGIIWPALYASMGYASHLAAKALEHAATPATTEQARNGLTYYWLQFGLNNLWSYLFFGFKQPGAALVNLVTLTGLVGKTIYELHPIDHRITYLLAPYAAWLGFATYLNAGFWFKNYTSLGRKRTAQGKDL